MTPIVMPDLGTEGQPVCISAWFVEPGDLVESGDRVMEVLVTGVTCDLPAPAAGRIVRIEKPTESPVHPGDVLGWIDPAT